MKLKTVLTLALALLFLNTFIAGADELTDLQDKVEKLNKKIEKLEKEPSVRSQINEALGKQTSIGGHFKFFLADQTTGEVNDKDQNNSFAMGINNLWLYFNKTLTDWLKLSVAPEIAVVAEATPSLGGPITRAGSASIDVDLDEAYFTVRLPKLYELKVGAFYPLFSEEYATKSWWHEQYHNNNGLVTLEAWQSTGIELYRNFDFAAFSLPVYLSLINGEDRGLSQDSRFTDNNNSLNVLIHVSPEFFVLGGRLRLLASAGGGRWDDEGDNDAYQLAGGAEFSRSSLTVSGEYLHRYRADIPLIGGGTADGTDQGYYLKARYEFSPKWRLLVKYSDVRLWAIGTDELSTDTYQSLTGALAWWITDSSTIMPQIEYVTSDRDNTDDKLNYIRYTLGWRTTF